MATANNPGQSDPELVDRLVSFYRTYYHDEIATLAKNYPADQQSLTLDYHDLERFDPNIADDYITNPGRFKGYFEEALRQYDLPIDVSLTDAHVRVNELPDRHVFYPGTFSPTDRSGQAVGLRGDISKTTAVYSKMVEAAFECQRCGTLTKIPQSDAGEFAEPHECQGCERDGPFNINFDQSEFIDAQQLRVQTPPEIADGAGEHLDVFAEEDIADTAQTGDRVTITGEVHLEQQSEGNNKTGRFDPYLEAHAVTVDESDHTDLDISTDDRARITKLANGEEGPPVKVAAESLAPKIFGYDHIKEMLVLAMVGGQKVVGENGDHDRGEFHILLLGDPGTAKSKLLDAVNNLGWRTVGMSGKGATVAGTTATAKQDDFGPAEWTLEAGAFVKAHKGMVAIDELDDMDPEVRASMLEPMSKQRINVNKAGINAELSTETAVVAAGNPKYGRWDEYEPLFEQFDLEDNLISRFDLIYTVSDDLDPDEDQEVAEHVLETRDESKRKMSGLEVTGDEKTATPVDQDILRKWVAVAKDQDPPVFADDEVKEWLKESFTDLRGIHGHDEDATVPVTFRKLEGIVRIAEAAAKLELSDTIEMRHARLATNAVGESIRDYGTNEDGELDADVQESGQSKSEAERKEALKEVIKNLQSAEGNDGSAPVETIVEAMEERGYRESKVWKDIKRFKNKGMAYEPNPDSLRWVGST